MLSDVAEELHHRNWTEPICIVDDAGGVCRRLKVEKAAQLLFDSDEIFFDLLVCQELALFCLAAWVSNQTGAATGDRDRHVAESLQTRQPHYRQKRADMKARRRRIEANVCGKLFLLEHFAQLGRGFSEHAAPLKFVEEVHVDP